MLQHGCDSGTAPVTDSITGSTNIDLHPPPVLHHSHHCQVRQKLLCSIHQLQAAIEQFNEPHSSLLHTLIFLVLGMLRMKQHSHCRRLACLSSLYGLCIAAGAGCQLPGAESLLELWQHSSVLLLVHGCCDLQSLPRLPLQPPLFYSTE